MTKGFHKKKSKRILAKRRYKIEKKVREHNRKLRRESKKKKHHGKKAKDPGVPNSLPFKEEVLREAQEDKRKADEYRELMRNKLNEERKSQREKAVNNRRNIDLSELKEDAEKRAERFDKIINEAIVQQKKTGKNDVNPSNLKSYYKEFQKVVDAADVIIEVLDARDPLGSRCPQVEEAVIRNGANKRLIFLLNKVDLIPRDVLQKWLKFLRNEFPTVAFKASTQTQKSNLSRSRVNVLLSNDNLLQSSKCLGADVLMKLLSNYCRNKNIKTSITVGIVGFPNVGKSSVINSLKRSRACNVGSIPGVTKVMQEVSLDKHIKLLDCPGIVFANTNQSLDNQQIRSLMALRNVSKIETLDDPISPVEAILARINREELMLHYRIPTFNDVNEFLSLLAKRIGKLKKGGVPDTEGAARHVLNEWNDGKIKYYTIPPESQSLPTHISAEIVSVMAKEFSIDDYVHEEEMKEIDLVIPKKVNESNAFKIPTLGFIEAKTCNDNNEQMDTMDTDLDDTKSILSEATTIRLKEKKPRNKETPEDIEMKELDGMQLNRAKKVQFKKQKKQRKRDAKLAKKLSSTLKSNVNLNDDDDDDDYSFETDFK